MDNTCIHILTYNKYTYNYIIKIKIPLLLDISS